MSNQRILHLDVWRLISIGFVLVFHVCYFSHPWYREHLPGIVWRTQGLGPTGVHIFFCISGFVICRGMIREVSEKGAIDLRGFYIRRAFRILPPLFVFFLAVSLLNALGLVRLPSAALLKSATFLCNIPALGDCGWALGHTWSLAYEEQFYLIFPLLFSSMALTKNPRAALMITAAIVIGYLIALGSKHNYMAAYLENFLCIVAGSLFALYWTQLQPALLKLPLFIWLLAAASIPAASAIAIPPFLQQIVFPVTLPFIICIAVFGTPTHHPAIRAIFTNPQLIYLGKTSYGIYLWQQLATGDYGFATPIPGLILMPAIFVFAHLSYKYFEMPLVKRGATYASMPIRNTAPIAVHGFVDPLNTDPGRDKFC